jgi:hypothetical protein
LEELTNKDTKAAKRFLASIVRSSQNAIIGKTLAGTIVSWGKSAEFVQKTLPRYRPPT